LSFDPEGLVDLLEDLRILDPIFNNFNPRELAIGLIDLIEGFLPDGIDMPDWLEDILALNRVRLHFHMKVKSKTEVCESASKDRKERLSTPFLLLRLRGHPHSKGINHYGSHENNVVRHRSTVLQNRSVASAKMKVASHRAKNSSSV
jgi:hypothetical protein